MPKYILFDTETTGRTDEDRIIQIGAMIVDIRGKAEVYDELYSTSLPISIEALKMAVTRLDNESVYKQTR